MWATLYMRAGTQVQTRVGKRTDEFHERDFQIFLILKLAIQELYPVRFLISAAKTTTYHKFKQIDWKRFSHKNRAESFMTVFYSPVKAVFYSPVTFTKLHCKFLTS